METFRPGDIVKVRLTVTPAAGVRHVALVDPIPAAAEIVNTRLSTEGGGRSRQRRRYRWVHHEYRDDRALAFSTRLSAREHVFEYLMRVVRPGTFRVPGPEVEAMYSPELRARAGAQRIEVAP